MPHDPPPTSLSPSMNTSPRTPMPMLRSARPPSPAPSASTLPPPAPSPQPSRSGSTTPPVPSPPPESYPYPNLDQQRRQLAAENASGKKKRKLSDTMRAEHLLVMRDRFTDAIEGRDPEALQTFNDGYTELWELLQERDQLADLERLHLKKIDRLSDRCFDLEESRDKWRERCQTLRARLEQNGLPSHY